MSINIKISDSIIEQKSTLEQLEYCALLNTSNIETCLEYNGLYCQSYTHNESQIIVVKRYKAKSYNCSSPTTLELCPGGYYCIG